MLFPSDTIEDGHRGEETAPEKEQFIVPDEINRRGGKKERDDSAAGGRIIATAAE